MTKKMLIDAAHPEEVRVAVLSQNRIEDFDFESAAKKPLRGNIFLARVTRVEPSLQAAFVDYGGNRHGFLAFSEIHPDYYQIPVSDRKALQDAENEVAELAAQLELAQRGDDDDDDIEEGLVDAPSSDESDDTEDDAGDLASLKSAEASEGESENDAPPSTAGNDEEEEEEEEEDDREDDADNGGEDPGHAEEDDERARAEELKSDEPAGEASDVAASESSGDDATDGEEPAHTSDDKAADAEQEEDPESDSDEEPAKLSRDELFEKYKDAKRKRSQLLRNYKIQEVIKRRQILLIQVVKEERGNKGAALTTYMSLAGRYCVLMPNTARGGGISRKIANGGDRRRLRRVVDSLEVPRGMGLIIRTAGAKRTKTEIKRDYDYLLRLWENIRSLTLKSIAPCLIYEEANLIKRSIRDLYDKDISKVYVEGEEGYREAKDFMKMLMPSHAKNVQPYKEKAPIFLKHGVESQLDGMYQPTVRLKSGGYLVIHQTEALVAIDVNSGRATRERNIEQTALKTNIEAAEEAARQFRLRDLAGLIVIDFIDMEEPRNNRKVEKALKEAMKTDRARVQVGRISPFGLLELSRQRRRSGIVDGTTRACPTCAGAGVIRSHEIASLRILRALEGEAISGRAGLLTVRASIDVALHILNHNRDWLTRIETNNGVTVEIVADTTKAGDDYDLEKSGAPREVSDDRTVIRADQTEPMEAETDDTADNSEADDDSDVDKPKKRRRRRRPKKESKQRQDDVDTGENDSKGDDESDTTQAESGDTDNNDGDEKTKKRRRRGRRGGRRNRRDNDQPEQQAETDAGSGPQPDVVEPVEASDNDKRIESSTAEKSGDDAENEAPEPAAAIEPEAAPASGSSSADETVNGSEGPALEANEAADAEAESAPEPPKEKKKPRRGWWSRSA